MRNIEKYVNIIMIYKILFCFDKGKLNIKLWEYFVCVCVWHHIYFIIFKELVLSVGILDSGFSNQIAKVDLNDIHLNSYNSSLLGDLGAILDHKFPRVRLVHENTRSSDNSQYDCCLLALCCTIFLPVLLPLFRLSLWINFQLFCGIVFLVLKSLT
jgi:hypothetical protein